MLFEGFTGGSNVTESPISDQQQTFNLYYEQVESPAAPSHSALYPTPGVTTLSTTSTGPGKANFTDPGTSRQFAVIGTSFVEINSLGATTVLGTVAIDDNPATICSNGAGGGQLFITSGDNGYTLDLSTNVLTQSRTGATTQGAALDGYFIALDAATGTIFVSDLLDGLTWDPTQFAQRSTQADPWISMKVSPANRYIYLLGKETGEVWFDAGLFPFPFALLPSGAIPYGIAAPFSIAVCEGTVTWLASTKLGTGLLVTAAGLTPQVVSTFAFTYAVSNYWRISDAVGDSYSEVGHLFYLLTFPTVKETWAYDFNSPSPMSITRRGTWIAENNDFTYLRAMWHAYAYGQHRMLDLETGAIYQQSINIGTDVDGRPIRRVRRAPSLQYELQRVFWSAFELDLETGIQSIPVTVFDPNVWGHLNNVLAVGGTLTKTSAQGLGNAGAISTNVLNGDGYAEFTVNAPTTGGNVRISFGLGPAAEWGGYPTASGINYYFTLIRQTGTNQASILQLGIGAPGAPTNVTLTDGDVFRVGVSGTTVSFYKNGTLLYTSATPAVLPLAMTVGSFVSGVVTGATTSGSGWAPYSTLTEYQGGQVMLRMSNDGGKTWGNEQERTVGAIGEYQKRVRWNRCGQSRRRVFEVSVTDTIPWRILNAYLTPLQAPRGLSQSQASNWGG